MTRILVVEDEGIIALDIQASLERLGYEVVGTEARGDRAVATARTERPDLVLMDIHLEGEMDGIDAAGQIRRDLDIPVVFLTAYTDAETLARAKITEPFGYAVKPFQERELHSAVEVGIYKHAMERQVREQRNQLDAILRSLGDGLVAFDPEGKVRYMNGAAAAILECDAGKAVGAILPGTITLETASDHPFDLASNAERDVTGTLTRPDGTELPIEASVAKVTDQDGHADGWVMVLRDITLRRRTEDTLRRMASVVQSTDDAMISVDREGHILLWNPGARRMFGLDANQATGRSLELFLTGPARHEAATVRRALRDGTSYERRALTVTRPDGSEIDVDLNVTPLRESDGRPWGAVVTLTDVDTRRALLREAEAVRAALRERASQLI